MLNNKTIASMLCLTAGSMIILQPETVHKAVGLGIFLGIAFAIGLFHKE